MQRIIFLDIDGPVIPNGCFAIDRYASYHRIFSPVCIHLVGTLAVFADALIVTNSTHNYQSNDKTGTCLRTDLCSAGIAASSFHEHWRTKYPASRRMQSITEWQQAHGLADWVAFDDAKFTTDSRLIWIDPDVGVTVRHFNVVAERWELQPFWVW